MKDGKIEFYGRKIMSNKIDINTLIDMMLKESTTSTQDYFNKINVTPSDFKKYKSKGKKSIINQSEDDEDINKSDSLKKKEAEPESKTISKPKVKPDFSEEEKEDYSEIKIKDANVFRKVIKLIGRFRAGYSIEESEANEKFKRYFTDLTLAEREILYIFLKAFVIMVDPEINDAYNEESEETGSRQGSKVTSLPLPNQYGLRVSGGSIVKKEEKPKEEKSEKPEEEKPESGNQESKPEEKDSKSVDKETEITTSPIVVGESKQDKSNILKLLKEYSDD